MTERTILIVAGDPSGDRHAADLVRELSRRAPHWRFTGIGGDHLAAAGVELIEHLRNLAILGFMEVLRHLAALHRLLRRIEGLLASRIDAVILVDYPGFNLRVAALAKKYGLPVIYYICPQLWAWGQARIKKLRQRVDLPLVIFPFEERFYHQRGLPARFVGHPLVDQLCRVKVGKSFFQQHGLPGEAKILGLFPGSREQEVRRHLPTMLAAAEQVHQKWGLLPAVGAMDHLPEASYASVKPPVRLIRNDTHRLMAASHLAVVSSGTATLELAYFQVPMVVVYRVAWSSYWLARMLVRIPNIALANIVLGKKVVPELVQGGFRVEQLLAELEAFLKDAFYYQQTRDALGRVREVLGEPGAAQRAAQHIVQFLQPVFALRQG